MRNFVKFLGNFIGVVLSLVLSIALLGMLIFTPMLSGVSALTRQETISQVIQEIDFAQFFLDNFRNELSEEEKREMDFLVELTKTNAFKDLMELYAIDISNAFEETPKPTVLTKEALRKIMNDNMEELIRIVRLLGEREGEDMSSKTDEELEQDVREVFEEVVDRFLELVPTVEDLRNLMARISKEFSTDSSTDNERPNSNNKTEESFDTSFNEPNGDGYEGGGTITYIPGEGDGITSVIIGPDGNPISGGDGIFYIVDENGNIVITGGEGGTATSGGGTLTFGKAVVFQNGTIRVLFMGAGQPGEEAQEKEQEEIADWFLKFVVMAKNGTLTLLMVGVMAVLALLICLLRWPRFKGLMWVAVMLLIGALLSVVVAVAYTVLPGIIAAKEAGSAGVISAVSPVLRIITNSMYVAAAIYAGVAIVLIVLFALLRKVLRKQKAARLAADAKAEAIEEVADAAEANALAVEAWEEPSVEEDMPAAEEDIPAVEEEVPAEEAELSSEEEVLEAGDVLCEEAQIPANEEEVPSKEEAPAE